MVNLISEMTKEQYKLFQQGHKKMWTWIADHIKYFDDLKVAKNEYFKYLNAEYAPVCMPVVDLLASERNRCYACACKTEAGYTYCVNCPLKKYRTNDNKTCFSIGEPYYVLYSVIGDKNNSIFARDLCMKIANMEWEGYNNYIKKEDDNKNDQNTGL